VGQDRAVSRLPLVAVLKLGFMFPEPAALKQLLSYRLLGQSSKKLVPAVSELTPGYSHLLVQISKGLGSKCSFCP